MTKKYVKQSALMQKGKMNLKDGALNRLMEMISFSVEWSVSYCLLCCLKV